MHLPDVNYSDAVTGAKRKLLGLSGIYAGNGRRALFMRGLTATFGLDRIPCTLDEIYLSVSKGVPSVKTAMKALPALWMWSLK